jgi:hypothetical protein
MNKNQVSINKEISIIEFFEKIKNALNYVFNRIHIVILSAIFGIFIGCIFSIIQKPKFKAVLTFALEEDKSGLGGNSMGGIANTLGIDIGNAGGGVFASSNIIDLIKSKLIIKKALLNHVLIENEEKTLLEYYVQFNNISNNSKNIIDLFSLKKYPNLNENNFKRNQDSIFNVIYSQIIDDNNLRIYQKDKKVSILYIEIISKNELFSKIFCETLARETSNFYIETKSKKAKLNLEILQNQVDSLKIDLNSSISSVASMMDNVYNLNPAFNIKGSNAKKKQIDVQSNTTILTNLTVQLELAKINLRKETPLIQLIDTPTFPLEFIHTSKKMGALVGFILASVLSILTILIFKSFQKENNEN